MNLKPAIFAAVAAAALAGCVQDRSAPIGPDFGNSVKHNLAAQIIDPNPRHADGGRVDMDGARAASAYQRYREGKVKSVKAESTTSGVAGN